MSFLLLLFFQINAVIFTFILIKESLYHNKRYVSWAANHILKPNFAATDNLRLKYIYI